MRTSRISRDVEKLATAGATLSPPPTVRRSARVSSLSRFAYAQDAEDGVRSETSLLSSAPDIEDMLSPSQLMMPPPSKRRRTAAVTMMANSTTSSKSETVRISIKNEEEEETKKPAPSSPQKPARRKPARKIKKESATAEEQDDEYIVEPPTDWEEIYALVKTMRLHGPAANAAVDTMGCERLAFAGASRRDRRFHTLIALMLSSQTKDTVNAVAMRRLQTELPAYADGKPAGLNLENVLAVKPEVLNQLIWQVGFHNNKTKYIKQTAEILRDKFDSDIPPTIEGLTSLPGVGPKMAYLCMSAEDGWNRVEGIGVDVHVHRITNLWGWNKTRTPEETRAILQAWLPREKWKEINWLLVGFGQSVCLPVGRKCGVCEVGLKGLCRAADRKKIFEGRKMRAKIEVEVEGEEIKIEEEVDGGETSVVKTEIKAEDVKVKLEEEAVDDVPLGQVLSTKRRRSAR